MVQINAKPQNCGQFFFRCPWKCPLNWKSNVISTHLSFHVRLKVIYLAWFPAINKKRMRTVLNHMIYY